MNAKAPTDLQLDDALRAPISGRHLEGSTLGEEVGTERTLLVFLRHFGWIFCRETVKVLRRAAREVATYPKVVFVHQGTVEEGEDFFTKFWPEARAIADPERELFTQFGLAEGTFGQLLGLRVIGAAVKSMVKGNGIGKKVGDVKIMPGAFLFEDGRIAWRHDYRHAGDHPDFLALG